MPKKTTKSERFKEKAEKYTNKAISQLEMIKKLASNGNRIPQGTIDMMFEAIQESIDKNRELYNRVYITQDIMRTIIDNCKYHFKDKSKECRISFQKIDSFETLKNMTLLVGNTCEQISNDFMLLYSINGATVYATQDIYLDKDASYLFSGSEYSYIDMRNVNTSEVTNMCMMFSCNAKGINLSQFDTSKVEDMTSMFENCGAESLDLSCFDTSRVKNMSFMFTECNLKCLNLESFDTSNVENMSNMFMNSNIPELHLGGFITKRVKDMGYMFYGCRAKIIDVHSFDTSCVEDMSAMFANCEVESLDLASFKFKNVDNMFSGCKACITGNIVVGKEFMKALGEAEFQDDFY